MINELSFYEFYESFDFKFDEIDKLIFEKACQGSEDVLDMFFH